MDIALNTLRRGKPVGNTHEMKFEVVPSFLAKDSYIYFWKKDKEKHGKLLWRQKVLGIERKRGIVSLSLIKEYLDPPISYPEFEGFQFIRVPEGLCVRSA